MKSNRTGKDFLILFVFLVAGMLLGRIVMNNWNIEVDREVEEIISQVVMLDVPPIDNAVESFLDEHADYDKKYITAIDISDKMYGIYELDSRGGIRAYAHGKCLSTGDAKEGVYYIEKTISHIDVDDVRYWRVVDMTDDLVVTSGGYEIDDLPENKIETVGFGNVMIDSGIMLTVYDNSDPGIALIVINSKEGKVTNEDRS